jgi:BMFP domain-containing protein YqiC
MPADYPDAVKDFGADVEDNVTHVMAAHVNDLRNEVEAIEAELGVLPKGNAASVAARLETLLQEPVFLTSTLTITTTGGAQWVKFIGDDAVIKMDSAFGLGYAEIVVQNATETASALLNFDVSQLTITGSAGEGLRINVSGEAALIGFYGGAAVGRGAALTAQLTTITHAAPGTPDYALQDLMQNTGFGFATKDEGNSVLSVIANLQARVAELEARLGSATGVNLFE